uniref:RNA polymerase factor sigma-54 n=1 Tax=Lachnoclostridium phocaeense TaxID=1871021 RepID=UPI0026DCDD5E|nr:RNA polymerase factor sigma-54 [Lachnoclostridium phocaeense]
MDFRVLPVLEQKQNMSANQVMSLEILTYTSQELENFLMKEYLENPMLESSGKKENEMFTDIESLYEKGKSYRDYYLEESADQEDRRSDVAAKSSDELKRSLLDQLHQKTYTPRQWLCMNFLIDCLEPTGYLTMDLDELSRTPVNGADCFTAAELEAALAVLKTLEPAGIFAGDLPECLILQLERKGVEDPVLFCLIRDHMEALTRGQLSGISRKLKVSTGQLKQYIHEISLLSPRPILDVSEDEAHYIIPDIIVSRSRDSWDITINDSWTGEYSYNQYYIQMMQETTDLQLKQYFKEKLERARLIINSVEQRRQTLIRIVRFLLEYQQDYFESGGNLKPLTQEQAAEALGLHPSTISRSIKGKYIQYRQTVLMKSLFSAAVSSSEDAGSSSFSPQAVKERIRQLIEQEQAPLSDQKLSELLAQEGIRISRRGVAKYRMELGIADSRQRKLLK